MFSLVPKGKKVEGKGKPSLPKTSSSKWSSLQIFQSIAIFEFSKNLCKVLFDFRSHMFVPLI